MKKLKFILPVVSFIMIIFSLKVSAHPIFIETFSECREPGIYMYYKELSGKLLDCLCMYNLRDISESLKSKLSTINGKTIPEKDRNYDEIKGLAEKINELSSAIDYYIESWQNQFLDEIQCRENIDKLNKELNIMITKLLKLLLN